MTLSDEQIEAGLSVDAIIESIVTTEGGYADRKNDRGGCTNWGITKATLARWRKRHVTCAEVKALTRDEAKEILTHMYVLAPHFDQVPDEKLRFVLIDYGIHSGQATATKALQRVLDVNADGLLGPNTLAALQASKRPQWVYREVLALRLAQWIKDVAKHPEQVENALGWSRRWAALL